MRGFLKLWAILFVVCSVVGCAAFLRGVQTVKDFNDLARDTCHRMYGADEDALGMSVEDWCKKREILDPIFDLLSAQREAGLGTMGITRPLDEGE